MRSQINWAIRSLIGLGIALASAPLAADVIIAPPNSKTMRYGESRDHRITVYRARSKVAAPVVLLFGERGRQYGDPNWSLQFLIGGLVDNGIAVVGINLPGETAAADAENTRRALAFIQSRTAEDRLDLSRIAIAGHRSGAHAAALVATDPSYLASANLPFQVVRGAILLAGSLPESGSGSMLQDQVGAPNAPIFLIIYPKGTANSAHAFADLTTGLRKAGTPVVERTMVSGDGIAHGSPSHRATQEAAVFLRNRLK